MINTTHIGYTKFYFITVDLGIHVEKTEADNEKTKQKKKRKTIQFSKLCIKQLTKKQQATLFIIDSFEVF